MQLDEWSNGIGKHILRIEDGKNAVGNFRGEVVRLYQHWKNGRSIVCPGRETCALCNSTNEEDRKATGRFRVNFITKEAQPQALVFEGGKRVYDQMIHLNKDMPLEKAWVRISVTGKKQDKQTMLSIVPGNNGIVTPAEEKEVLKIKLHDLRVSVPEEADEPGSGG